MQFTYTRLLVDDFATTLSFYRDVLGLEVLLADDDWQYAELRAGSDAKISLFPKSEIASIVGTQSLSPISEAQDDTMLVFYVEDVDKTATILEGNGVIIDVPPQDREWGIRTVHFRDPDGRLIEVNGPLQEQ